jgi:hypothetical protein
LALDLSQFDEVELARLVKALPEKKQRNLMRRILGDVE